MFWARQFEKDMCWFGRVRRDDYKLGCNGGGRIIYIILTKDLTPKSKTNLYSRFSLPLKKWGFGMFTRKC